MQTELTVAERENILTEADFDQFLKAAVDNLVMMAGRLDEVEATPENDLNASVDRFMLDLYA